MSTVAEIKTAAQGLVNSSEVTGAILDEMVSEIVHAVQPERVYLFGSHATGVARADSDVDFLVVEREPFTAHRSRLAELTRIRKALGKFRIPKDIVVYSTDEVAWWKDSANHLVGQCLRQGKLMYER